MKCHIYVPHELYTVKGSKDVLMDLLKLFIFTGGFGV